MDKMRPDGREGGRGEGCGEAGGPLDGWGWLFPGRRPVLDRLYIVLSYLATSILRPAAGVGCAEKLLADT